MRSSGTPDSFGKRVSFRIEGVSERLSSHHNK
jgi:hypothetical protein